VDRTSLRKLKVSTLLHRPPPPSTLRISTTTMRTARVVRVKNEPRDEPPIYSASEGGVFREYEEAVKDIMFLGKALVTGTQTKMQYEEILSATPYQKMPKQHLAPAKMLRERLTHARNNKVLCLKSKLLDPARSSKSPSSPGKARDIPTIPIPNNLPKGTSSKQKDSGLLWSYREARKNAKKRKEASNIKNDLSQKAISSDWHPASKGMSEQRQQGLPQPFDYLNFDLSPFTSCVSPSLDAVVSSTSCMPMPDRSILSTFPVDDPMDIYDMQTTWPITSLVSHPASYTRLTNESEPRLAEKQEKQRAMEEKRLQCQPIDVASTASVPAAAPTTPPAKRKVLASDSSVASRRSTMSGQASCSSAYSSETRREVHKIKRELRELLRLSTANCDNESRSMLSQKSALKSVTPTLAPTKKTKVRFSNPLVTQVNLRPWTLEADMEELYFCPEELDELEWDRETTEADQYECIAQEQSSQSSENNVAIAHQLRRYEEAGNGDDVSVTTDDQMFCSTETDLISNAATE
jgi:hypothetical protein